MNNKDYSIAFIETNINRDNMNDPDLLTIEMFRYCTSHYSEVTKY